MRYLLLMCVFLIPQLVGAYSLLSKNIEGHAVRVFFIPRTDEYQVTAVAQNKATSLKDLVLMGSGVAGINGAYFIPRDYTKKPDETNTIRIVHGDAFSYSKYYPDTGVNGIFGFLHDGTPILVQNNMYGEKSLQENKNSQMILEVESGIANFPILLSSGANLVPRYDVVGLISAKMKTLSSRAFICRTEDNTVIMGTVQRISITDIPHILTTLGCVDAINLDNGGSSAMYDQGRYIFGPGRNIMDAFVIKRKG